MIVTTPGLIDVQVNGFAGTDFNDEEHLTAGSLESALASMLATGVTVCLPTLITADKNTLRRRIQRLDEAVRGSALAQLMVPGYHLEGPFLNAQEGYAGCHPPADMCSPDPQLIDMLEVGLSRPILKVTYAPEFDPQGGFARAMRQRGKTLAIGHSAADAATLAVAIASGATMSTHLGNGIPKQLPKFDSTLIAQTACDGLMAGFIADGLHIPSEALKVLLRSKTLRQAILVTDATSAAGVSSPGLYAFAGMEIERTKDGTVRVPGSAYLAGSSLTLDAAIRNVCRWHLATFEEAISMATTNPRRLMSASFQAYDITLPESEITWNADLRISQVKVGHEYRQFSV